MSGPSPDSGRASSRKTSVLKATTLLHSPNQALQALRPLFPKCLEMKLEPLHEQTCSGLEIPMEALFALSPT